MTFNGSGVFNRIYNWVNDANAAINITASRMDTEDSGFATGLSNTICKDGQTTITANIPFNGKRITGLGAATAATDAIQCGQVQNSAPTWLGTSAGTNTVTASATPTLTAYASGQTFRFLAGGTCTGAVTLNIDALGAKAVQNRGAALVAGDITLNNVCEVSYDGTQFQLISPAATIAATGGYNSPGCATNRYYLGFGARDQGATGALTANRLYIKPFMLGASAAFTRIGIRVTTGVSGNARLGIYNMANGLPTTLVQDCGTVSTTSTGLKEITITQTLAAGSYALALVANAAASIQMDTFDSPPSDFWGMDDAGTQLLQYFGAYITFAYAALPSPWSGALTYQGTNSLTPGIWMRVV